MADNSENSKGAALVIGGSGGLGSAICRTLASEWDGIFFTYNANRDAASTLHAELLKDCEAEYAAVDLRNADSIHGGVTKAIEHFGTIGTVVFAGGATIQQPYVADIAQQQWDQVIDIELAGFTRLVGEVIPMFRRQQGGTLVSVVSFANYHFPPGDALSAVPKAAIEMLVKAIAREEGRHGIRANSVAPGIINAGLGDVFQQTLFTAEIWESQRKRVPLKRFGEADEVADCVAFLASDRSRYITGQTIIVDGGLHL